MIKKVKPWLTQGFVYAVILVISWLISQGFARVLPDFPLPTPLIGLVMLYGLLTTGVLKLAHVERLSRVLIGIVSLIFIPSGVALVSQLEIMQSEGAAIIAVVVLSTVLMLTVTAGITWGLIKIKTWLISRNDQSAEQELD